MDWCNDDDGVDDYDLSCARADTARASDAVQKAGFRESFGSAGVDDVAMQAAFDAGYRAAVAPAYAIGILRGIINILRIAIPSEPSSASSSSNNNGGNINGNGNGSASADSLALLSQGVSHVINSLDILAQLSHDTSGGENNNNEAIIAALKCDKITAGLATSTLEITQLLNSAVQYRYIAQELADAVIAKFVVII